MNQLMQIMINGHNIANKRKKNESELLESYPFQQWELKRIAVMTLFATYSQWIVFPYFLKPAIKKNMLVQ